MLPIKVNITYTSDDLQKAYMLHFNKKQPFKSKRNLFMALALIAIGVFVYYYDPFHGELNWVCWFFMGYGFILLIVYYFRLLTIGKRYFRKLPQDKNLFPYTFSEDGISFQGEKSNKLIKWELFQSALITEKLVLLYSNEVKFNIFPRRSFTDEQFNEFSQIVKQHIANWK